MSTVTIHEPQILALMQDAYASREETRYYLNGVAIQPHENGHILVATDGHVIMAHLATSDKEEGRAEGERLVVLSGDLLRACRKGSARKVVFEFPEDWQPDQDVEATVFFFDDMTGRFFAKTIDGTFPDWRRIIPKGKPPIRSMRPASLSHIVAAKMAKTAKVLDRAYTLAGTNDQVPQVATFGDRDDVLVIAMPMRGDGPRKTYPDWVRK